MAIEIERKFLVVSDVWRDNIARSQVMAQAYLNSESRVTVRARIAGDTAWLTLKGASQGISQLEFEYEIPVADAIEIISELADSNVVHKTRHTVMHAGHEWVIDEFHDDNDGLIVAEIELESVTESFEVPGWAGNDVTAEGQYRNKYLAHHPYNTWQKG